MLPHGDGLISPVTFKEDEDVDAHDDWLANSEVEDLPGGCCKETLLEATVELSDQSSVKLTDTVSHFITENTFDEISAGSSDKEPSKDGVQDGISSLVSSCESPPVLEGEYISRLLRIMLMVMCHR